MLPNPLTAIFAHLRRHDAIYDGPQRFVYDCHRVDNPDLAESLRDWAVRRLEGRKVVEDFIYDQFAQKNIPYRTDAQGRLSHVLYCGQFLTMPKGWVADKGINHWMVPDGEDMNAKIDALPRLPTAEDLHALIGWPTIPVLNDSEEARCFATARNELVVPKLLAEQVFILTPAPDSIAHIPIEAEVAAAWGRWTPPRGLTPVPITEFRALEARYKDLKKGRILPFVRQN
jgi:hypothetical protein